MAAKQDAGGVFAIAVDASALERVSAAFRDLSQRQKTVVVTRALNRVGDQAYTQVVRDVAKQTGAKQRRVRAVVDKKKAWANSGSVYRIVARDGHMPLKDFNARPVKKGVSAAPWNKRRIFRGTFMVASLGGNVFRRVGEGRTPIKKLWGPAIPKEMVRGETAKNAMSLIRTKLPERIIHETEFELGRIKAKHRL